jgi:purine-cytosine permease-like protein
MNRSVLMLVLFVGLFFGSIASIMAYLITYEEYTKHFLEKRKPVLYAFQSAFFTFVVFVVIVCLVGAVLAMSLG